MQSFCPSQLYGPRARNGLQSELGNLWENGEEGPHSFPRKHLTGASSIQEQPTCSSVYPGSQRLVTHRWDMVPSTSIWHQTSCRRRTYCLSSPPTCPPVPLCCPRSDYISPTDSKTSRAAMKRAGGLCPTEVFLVFLGGSGLQQRKMPPHAWKPSSRLTTGTAHPNPQL